jgi:hypothetical protein
MRADQTRLKSISSQSIIVDRSPYNNLAKPLYTVCAFPYSSQTSRPGAGLDTQRACKLKPPAKFSYEATRFFIAEKLLSFFFVYGNSSIVDPIKNFSKPKSVINTSSFRKSIT